MKTLFIGGIKSGKSQCAEKYALSHASEKPIYLATNEFFDKEMQSRVAHHKIQRADKFITYEEPQELYKCILTTNKLVLVECVSMWINNMLHYKQDESSMHEQMQKILQLKQNIVFVINDVSCCVVSENPLTRKFVDINGRLAQLLASECDEVYNIVAGISMKIK